MSHATARIPVLPFTCSLLSCTEQSIGAAPMDTAVLEHPSAGSSILASGPTNFFSSSLSVPALFFLLPLFQAQLHFLFCLSILHAPSFSIPTSQMLPVVFAHSVVVFRSLHHTTLHSTQNTSLVFYSSFSKGPQKMLLFFGKSFFCHCYPLLYFLTAVHVATGVTPQVFEVVHLFDGFIFNSHVYLLLFSSGKHSLLLIYIYLHPIILTCSISMFFRILSSSASKAILPQIVST